MKREKANAELNDAILGRSNKRFDRSGISIPLIENLKAVRRFFPPGQSRRSAASHKNEARLNESAAQKHNERSPFLSWAVEQLIAADSPPAMLSSCDVEGGGSRLNSSVRCLSLC
jgi:hypothetical protein